MSYELWCFKDLSSTPYPYILLAVDSEQSSSVSATIRDAFTTFGVCTVSFHRRSQARPFYDIIPVAYLDGFCDDHPELLL